MTGLPYIIHSHGRFHANCSAEVGLSRHITSDPALEGDANQLHTEVTITPDAVRQQENNHLFTPEELAQAMTAATIK
ncbi:hypothetical protein HC762_01930 [bacterium]|nr:hypothetical protein [bacterium]